MSFKTFKITVIGAEWDEQVYIKHFVDMLCPCFEQFKQKIFCRFPKLREKEIKLYWIDSEKDHVTIFNEDDFRVSVDQSVGTYCKLYLEEKALMKKKQTAKIIPNTEAAVRGQHCTKTEKNSSMHVNVSCDSCGVIIHGYRYKCLECPNYNLCMDCDIKLMFHREHSMIRSYLPIKTPAAPEKKEDIAPKEQIPSPAVKKLSEAKFENYSAQPSTSYPKDVKIELNRYPILQGDEIFESHNNMSPSMVKVEPVMSESREPSTDIDEEWDWDVIDEEITLNNLEKRRNSPSAAGVIPKATAPKILSTKISSTITSFDDIPKSVKMQSTNATGTPPRETAAGEPIILRIWDAF